MTAGGDAPDGLMPMPRPDADHIAEACVSYALGRTSYVPGTVCRMLVVNANRIGVDARSRLAGLIRTRIDRWEHGQPWARHPDDLVDGWRRACSRLERGRGVEPPEPSGLVIPGMVDRRIVFFSAFRDDMHAYERQPDGQPGLWERYASLLPGIVLDPEWARNTMRDLLWEGLIPAAEPAHGIQTPEPRPKDANGDWLGLYRLLAETQNTGKEKK